MGHRPRARACRHPAHRNQHVSARQKEPKRCRSLGNLEKTQPNWDNPKDRASDLWTHLFLPFARRTVRSVTERNDQMNGLIDHYPLKKHEQGAKAHLGGSDECHPGVICRDWPYFWAMKDGPQKSERARISTGRPPSHRRSTRKGRGGVSRAPSAVSEAPNMRSALFCRRNHMFLLSAPFHFDWRQYGRSGAIGGTDAISPIATRAGSPTPISRRGVVVLSQEQRGTAIFPSVMARSASRGHRSPLTM
jgi:hypothetical protein